MRLKGRALDEDREALAAARQQKLDDAAAEARAIVDKARRQAEETAADARLQAEAVLDTAKEQAHAQARRLVEAAAVEANEVQNAHQLRLNSMREEVRSLEQRREQLIVFLNRMARELMQVEGTAKSETVEPAPLPDPSPALPELQEVPTPPVELDLGPEAIARAVDELRAQAAAEEDSPEPDAEPAKAEPPAATAKPAPEDHDPTRQTGPALTEVPGRSSPRPLCGRRKTCRMKNRPPRFRAAR